MQELWWGAPSSQVLRSGRISLVSRGLEVSVTVHICTSESIPVQAAARSTSTLTAKKLKFIAVDSMSIWDVFGIIGAFVFAAGGTLL